MARGIVESVFVHNEHKYHDTIKNLKILFPEHFKPIPENEFFIVDQSPKTDNDHEEKNSSENIAMSNEIDITIENILSNVEKQPPPHKRYGLLLCLCDCKTLLDHLGL